MILQAYAFMFKLLEPDVGKRLSAKDALKDEVCPRLMHSRRVLIPRCAHLVARPSKETNLKLTNAFMGRFRKRIYRFKCQEVYEGKRIRHDVAGLFMEEAFSRVRVLGYVNYTVRSVDQIDKQ